MKHLVKILAPGVIGGSVIGLLLADATLSAHLIRYLPRFPHDALAYAAVGVALVLALQWHAVVRFRRGEGREGAPSAGQHEAAGHAPQPTLIERLHRPAKSPVNGVADADPGAAATTRYRCKPIPRYYRRQADGSMAVGAPMSAFCMFFVWVAYAWFHTLLLSGVGTVMLLCGIYLLLAPLRFKRRAAHVEYLVSDAGASILFKGRPFRHYAPESFSAASVDIRRFADGAGSIILPTRISGSPPNPGSGYREEKDVGFYGIPDIDVFLASVHGAGP